MEHQKKNDHRDIGPPANDVPITLGTGARLTGNISAPVSLYIFGHVQGYVRAASVFIGNGAFMSGTLVAVTVVVAGRLSDTNIYANRVELRKGSEVTGEIYCDKLEVSEGSYFEGKHRRIGNPMSMAPDFE